MGMVKKFARLLKVGGRGKASKPARKDLKRPRVEKKPPAKILPGIASKPMDDLKPLAPPPDVSPAYIGPDKVARHDEEKATGEKFKYVDGPLKLPVSGGDRKPEVIKYKAAPAIPPSAEKKKPAAEVFKYKPVRVEIKGKDR